MKKFIAITLLLAMSLALFAGCAGDPKPTEAPKASELESAKAYLFDMYRKTDGQVTAKNYEVLASVKIGETVFPVEWAIEITAGDKEAVKIGETKDNMVNVEIVNAKPAEEVQYKLTATIKDADGKTASFSLAHHIPAAVIIGDSYEDIVKAAYKLEVGMQLDEAKKLAGKIISIDTPYSDQYHNVTVTIQIGDLADMPIQCFRLVGDGVDKLAEGDMITVEGILKNYNGKIEFDAKCKLLSKDGNAESGSNNGSNSGSTGASLKVQGKPEAGKSYKMAMYQGNLGKTLFFTGKPDAERPWYLGTTENPSEAADVFVEAADGGFKLYVKEGEAKKYLGIANTKGNDGNMHVNALIGEAETVFTWDDACKTLVVSVNDKVWCFGTRSDKEYTTISASYADKGFVCEFYA